MRYQYVPYVWLLLASALMSGSLGIYALSRRKSARGASVFALSMGLVTLWSLCNALEMSSIDLSAKLFWANMQYFAYCFSPVTLLIICLQFTGQERVVQDRRIWWLSAIPVLIVLLVWTDGWHSLMRRDIRLDLAGAFPVIAKQYGPAFYVHAAYAHALNLAAWVMLIRAVIRQKRFYKRQAVALLCGVSLIVVPNILYVIGISPVQRLDLTPVFFGPAGLLIAWGIFRYKMLDLVPLARSTVIETMSAGVIVLDLQDRVLDINPAGERILGLPVNQAVTRHVQEVCAGVPELAAACIDSSSVHIEFSMELPEAQPIYQALLSPLLDGRDSLIGRLVVIHEVTDQRLAQRALLEQQRKLAATEEREKLARDLHDDLGQVLGFVSLQAQGIRQELVKAGVATGLTRIDRLVEAAQLAHQEIREYVRIARSAAACEQNFVDALGQSIAAFEQQSGATVRLVLPPGFSEDMLAPEVRTNLHYVLKEVLSNVRKHAHARAVLLSLALSQGILQIDVEDDGRGFDPGTAKVHAWSGFGLGIMRDRITEIGGTVEFLSASGRGTHIVLRVPTRKGASVS